MDDNVLNHSLIELARPQEASRKQEAPHMSFDLESDYSLK